MYPMHTLLFGMLQVNGGQVLRGTSPFSHRPPRGTPQVASGDPNPGWLALVPTHNFPIWGPLRALGHHPFPVVILGQEML